MLCVPADPCSLDNFQKIVLTLVMTIELKSVVDPTSHFWKKASVRTGRRADSKDTSPELSHQGHWQWEDGCRFISNKLHHGQVLDTTGTSLPVHCGDWLLDSPEAQTVRARKKFPPFFPWKWKKRKRILFSWKTLYTKVPKGQFWLVFWAIYMGLYSPLFFWEGD